MSPLAGRLSKDPVHKSGTSYVADAWCVRCDWAINVNGDDAGGKMSQAARRHTLDTGHETQVDSQFLWSWRHDP